MLVAAPSPASDGVRAVGLLEHEPVLAGAPRGADDGRGIELVGDAHGDRREHLAAAAPGAPHGEREPRRQRARSRSLSANG